MDAPGITADRNPRRATCCVAAPLHNPVPPLVPATETLDYRPGDARAEKSVRPSVRDNGQSMIASVIDIAGIGARRAAQERAIDLDRARVSGGSGNSFSAPLRVAIPMKGEAAETKGATDRRDDKNPCPATVKFYDLEK